MNDLSNTIIFIVDGGTRSIIQFAITSKTKAMKISLK